MGLRVEKLLKEKGIEYRLIKLSQNAYTVDDVIKYSKGDINPEEICKTIILSGKKSGKKRAIMLRGNNKVNFSEIKKVLGEEMTIASEEQVKDASGVEPGAVCPFLLNVILLVDNRVMDLERINCGSGDHLYGLEFRSKDLGKAIDYKIVDLAKIPVISNLS
jgi:prolyl-tRNA editing enzyme YbaK/EbsC (Cys-tRNA(Pro) deacylase)